MHQKPRRRVACSSLSTSARGAALAFALGCALGAIVAPGIAHAELPVQRTFFRLASSNGHGALMLDLTQARLTHFREHLFAAEEPLLDASGNEVWNGNQPQSVASRDLLLDAYFGLRVNGNQGWLTSWTVDLDKSGYAPWQAGKTGGTGVVTMLQNKGALEVTQFFFAPRALPHAGFVMALRFRNNGGMPVPGVAAFSLHNFHLGFGRPGVMSDGGAEGETVVFDGSSGKFDLVERAFAGVVVSRGLGVVSHHAASTGSAPPASNLYGIVNAGGAANLPDLNGQAATADDSVSAFQIEMGTVQPNEDQWVAVVSAHHGDPFATSTVQGWLDAYVGNRTAKQLVDDEIASWASFQQSIKVPKVLSADEETLLRQSAVTLDMAQVKDDTAYLRDHLTNDADLRKTRFGTSPGGPPATLPNTVAHRGHGAVIASLPPGEWTVAWIRDGSYAAAAMAALGMKDQARDALSFYLNAESGRFQSWDELKPYNMPPYLPSLVRYQGFGVEETDFNDFGPNLELDGFGLFLWALHHYEAETGDTTLVDSSWPKVSTKVADVIVALVDPATGLLRPDSSIWETHWNGRERTWAYTNITAARGLCDAAALAKRVGDTANAEKYGDAGNALRAAIATRLTDGSRAIASNAEELAAGEGYWDAAVLDAIAFGLFDPHGEIAKATLAGLDQHLAAPAGAGWSRNDDRTDHAGANDVSPWGSPYDSAEWVVTDLRGAVATRLMGDTARSDRLLAWVRDQSLANYLAVSETYDEATGVYKFNAPMVGFGAGVYALALANRASPLDAPACGAYFDETLPDGGASSSSGSSAGGAGGAGGSGAGGSAESDGGCGCRMIRGDGSSGGLAACALVAAIFAARRRRGASLTNTYNC